MLIYLSPFVSLALNYIAFAIFVYRIVRYDESVFAIDYCGLAAVSYIFLSTGRVSLLAWLSIIAAVWYILRNGIIINSSMISFVLLFDFLLLRMQSAYNSFVLCFSQILLLYVLISTQRVEYIPKSIKAFAGNVVLSSIYALVLRNNYHVRNLLGKEVVAYWGSTRTRFQGLLRDPNYYMTLVVIAMVLIIYLYLNGYSSKVYCFTNVFLLLFFGAITYSKTYVIVLAFLALFLIVMLIYKKKYIRAIAVFAGMLGVGLIMANTILSVTLYRITSASNLHELTTGRNELIVAYIKEISKSVTTLFWGNGLSAQILRRGTHNLFLEIVFYFGLVGLMLMVTFVWMLIAMMKRHTICNTNGPFRYLAFAIFLILFCTLQGITFGITYEMLYLTILATAIVPQGRNSA